MPSWSGLKKRLPDSACERRRLAEPGSPIPLARQCELLSVNRSSLYYRPRVNQSQLVLDKAHMNAIDEIYTECPFYGSRRVRVELHYGYGIDVGRERVQRLMRQMGIEAIYPKPDTSKAAPQHETYPYLLKGLAIVRPNQVLGSDITYIRTAKGFIYLVAFIDWFSRYVISWRLSDNMELAFCLAALDEALSQARPEISNTDQGSQFTAEAFTSKLKVNDVKISMDGRGRCMDNIFTERLWRTVKYENVYLQSYRDLGDAQAGLDEYFSFYNERRRHQALQYRTPHEVYFQ
jgi:putative transposase